MDKEWAAAKKAGNLLKFGGGFSPVKSLLQAKKMTSPG